VAILSKTIMKENHILSEWQSLGEEIHGLIEKHKTMAATGKPEHYEAVVRIEGFLEALRGLAQAWEAIEKQLPLTEPDEDETAASAAGALSQVQFCKPLAQALLSLGGSAKPARAIERVGIILADRLIDVDRATLRTGRVRWDVNTRFARWMLIQRGLMSGGKHGIWELTDAGRRYAESDLEHLPNQVPAENPDQLSLF
jgi:hypothetical protein